MGHGQEAGETPRPSPKSRLYRAIPYTLTGACLWYTNYSAPVFFFVHLVVAAVRADRRRQIVTDLAFSWLAILLLFSPWLPTFFRQLGTSVRGRSLAHMGLSLYVLFAGEFSTPFDLWISLPAAAVCVLLAVLVVAQRRRCWIPAVTCAVAVLALLQTGAIGPKRLLIVSPFLAITLGIVLGNTALGNTALGNTALGNTALGNARHGRRRLKAARCGLALLAVLVSAGSAVNLTRRSGWIAYRWLDPCEGVVRRIQSRTPQSLIISNSNPVFFFLQDEYGKTFCRVAQETDTGYRPKVILFRLEANHGPFCQRMLAEAETAVWVYHSPYHGPISKWYDDMVRQMHRFGFRVAQTEPFLRVSPEFLRFHPKFRDRSADPLDEHRIVTVYFVKSAPGEPPTSPRIAQKRGQNYLRGKSF